MNAIDALRAAALADPEYIRDRWIEAQLGGRLRFHCYPETRAAESDTVLHSEVMSRWQPVYSRWHTLYLRSLS